MNKMVSIEEGIQIVMLFLLDFWCKFLKNMMIQGCLINPEVNHIRDDKGRLICSSTKDDLYDDNNFFFTTICNGTFNDYFEKVIEKRMHIFPFKKYNNLIVKEEQLFQLAIDFCDYFNKRHNQCDKDSLRFAINWLKDMRKYPKEHNLEWNIWNKIVSDVVKEHGERSVISKI